jgi:hypothetical protein
LGYCLPPWLREALGRGPKLPGPRAASPSLPITVRRWQGLIENPCDHGGVTPEQRRQAIERRLAEDPAVTQQQLAAELGTSQSQVQRDVTLLRKRGVLPAGNPSGRGRPAGSVTKLPVSGATIDSGAGEQLVARLRAELDAKGLEPDAREEGLLLQIRQVADEIAELRQTIDAEGHTFAPATKGGPPRVHPLIAEVRQLRSLLGRLLQQISLEESTRNPVKARAAASRWRRHNLARQEGS